MSSWNLQVHVVGPPECGKTTVARKLGVRHLELGGYFFVHDPNGQYRDLCVWYPNVAAVRAALVAAAKKGKPIARGFAVGGSSSELIAFLLELGQRHNRADHVRMRILLVLDETSLHDGSGASWMEGADNQLLSNRRHRGIGVVFLMQRIKQLPTQFYEMCTHVVLFRQAHPQRVRSLEEDLNLPAGTLAPAAELPDHAYIVARNGKGLLRAGEAIL